MEPLPHSSEPPRLSETDLMCIYRARTTGIPGCTVYISPRNASHAARVKVLESDKPRGWSYDAAIVIETLEWVDGSVSTATRRAVEQWVLLNRATLLAFWNSEIDDDCVELAERLVKVQR